MKTYLKITVTSFIAVLLLTSCASMNDSSSDNYFGYSNRPSYEEKEPKPSEPQTAQTNYSGDYYYSSPTRQETIVEHHYTYFNPIVYPGYYPWWAPPQRWHFYRNPSPTVYFGVSYGYYDVWDNYWYNYYYPRHYHYGYVYHPSYYHWHRPTCYGGWYSVPRAEPREPRNDTYRDFGPNRGGYGYTNQSPEQTPPANRRSGADGTPSVRTSNTSTNPTGTTSGTANTRSTSRTESSTSSPQSTPAGRESVRQTEEGNVRSGTTPTNRSGLSQEPSGSDSAPATRPSQPNVTPRSDDTPRPSGNTRSGSSPSQSSPQATPSSPQPRSQPAAPAPRVEQPRSQPSSSPSGGSSGGSGSGGGRSGSSNESSPSNRRTR